MVAGSNPARGASNFKHLAENPEISEKLRVCTVSANALQWARCAVAFPVYVVALVLDFMSGALGAMAAKIAGDDWPR
jgi:hypothetical protein